MKSINFEFLRQKWPELAGLGGFAESYAHGDPVGALTKLRSFCEQVVGWLHYELRLPQPLRASLIELLENQSFRNVVPDVIQSKLHALRIEGNKAVHAGQGNTTSALLGAISSATIPHLTGVKIKQIRVPFPPIELQRQFQSQVEKYNAIRARKKVAARDAEELFNALVQQAFNGAVS